MSTAPCRPMTLAEFHAWEDRQERKHELDGFGAVAMTGVTQAHAMIQMNLVLAIGGRLRAKGGRCRSSAPSCALRRRSAPSATRMASAPVPRWSGSRPSR